MQAVGPASFFNMKISKNNKKHLKFNNHYGILWGRNWGERMKKKRLACVALCAGAMVLFAGGRLPCEAAQYAGSRECFFLKEGAAAVGSVFERMGIRHGPAAVVLQNGRPVVVYRGRRHNNAPQQGQKKEEFGLCGIITGL